MEETLRIERMGYEEAAVAHLASGKTVFVEGACPGDVGAAAVLEEKASFATARLLSLDEASPVRVDQPCPYGACFVGDPARLRCGGCPWQRLDYTAQLAAKRENVVARLVRSAHWDAARAQAVVGEAVGSKREWGYRNKVELAAAKDARGFFDLGFYAANSHDVVAVDACRAAVRGAERAPRAMRGALRYLQNSGDLDIFRVGVRHSLRTRSTEIALWTRPGAFPRAAVAKTLGSALKATSIVRVLAEPGKERKIKGLEVLAGAGHWEEEVAGVRFMISAPSFFQVNTAQAETLVRLVLEGLGGRVGEDGFAGLDGAYVADLYAGCGTFSVPLALAGADVVAVESAGSSVRDLRRNADANGADVDVVGGDAGRELPDLGRLDALVVDPPRSGLGEGVVESIAAAAPERVAYVSCNPATWARDVVRFEDAGYRLDAARPVDLFPQTYHVEVASTFVRQEGRL
ncbi:23S rRNA (uracil(1939)-C(5))-methyltransferase RlmD [Eggerthellaceae bacterium zg-893]|nr:23S rRNA (uracil(1939)-C(5))-methyltransferase RlmD [Eggerthellaceae bacterium zg-893]